MPNWLDAIKTGINKATPAIAATGLIGGTANVASKLANSATPTTGNTGTGTGQSNTLNNFQAQAGPAGDLGQSYLQNYLDIQNNPQFSYLSGGPNQALIQQLAEQSKKKLDLYKQNRADAETMYGQLTTKVEGYGKGLAAGYDTSITDTGTQGMAAQQALSQELANQSARRSGAFKELGIEREGALTNYGSDTSLNAAMGNILSSSNAWQSLLRSQKGGAQERNDALRSAIGNTLNQTVLGMKEQYDAAKEYLDAQISAEKSKTATRKLNELGKMFSQGALAQLKNYTFGSTGTGSTSIEKKLANWNAVPSAKYGTPNTFPGGPTAWYNNMVAQAQAAYSQNKSGKAGQGVDPELIRFAQDFGLGPYLGVNYSAIYGG